MSLLDNRGDLPKQFAAGNAPAVDVHAAYDQVSQAVPLLVSKLSQVRR